MAFQTGIDTCPEQLQINRATEEIFRSHFDAADRVGIRVHSGNDDDRSVAELAGLTHPVENFEAVLLRHDKVQQHEVEFSLGESDDGFIAIGGIVDGMAAAREKPPQNLTAGLAVVGDENARRQGRESNLPSNQTSRFAL